MHQTGGMSSRRVAGVLQASSEACIVGNQLDR
jgi:hypothetical protein